MRTQVCIIGGGPSGLLLSQLLHQSGIESVIVERQGRDRVLSGTRAGVLEWGSVGMLARAGADARLKAEGLRQGGLTLGSDNRTFRIDFEALADQSIVLYGQSDVTRDLYERREAQGARILHEAQGAAIHDIDTQAPFVTCVVDGEEVRIDCDFVAGCDGYAGVSRASLPRDRMRVHEKTYPFGWLAVLSQTQPVWPELIYASHPRGLALCALRGDRLSRHYLQVPADDRIEKWTDAAFWEELRRRLPQEAAESVQTAASIEKYIVPLRACVTEPMSHGRLFLVGDAAHIVPPTAAKGLNLAVSDVHYLHDALTAYYAGERSAPERYAPRALARVWQALRFSCWMTDMLHAVPNESGFDRRLREAALEALERSEAARTDFALNYVGLPF
jgi:p-hydroxybenzoate 3-monooxygenase